MFEDEEILDLLDWMVDNGYELGQEGSEIFDKVTYLIDRHLNAI